MSEYKDLWRHHAVYEDDPTIWTKEIQLEIADLFIEYGKMTIVRNIFK